MRNISDEIRLLDEEIKKDTQDINELSDYIQKHYGFINDILLKPGKEGRMDIPLGALERKSRLLHSLKAHKDILLQARAAKLNKIILSETTNPPQDTPTQSTPEGIIKNNVSFDVETRHIWIDNNQGEKLEPKDAGILEIIIVTKKDQAKCRVEEVILKVYKKTINTRDKLEDCQEYNRLLSAISTINAAYRKSLKTRKSDIKLIQSDNRSIMLNESVTLR